MNRHRDERGAVLIMTALIMMLLLFIAAFATDLGAWYRQGQAQQQAADVSALNGMQAYERAVNTYFDTNGVSGWTALSSDQKFELEELAMIQALNTIVGLLETSGYTFNNNSYEIVNLIPPPNAAGDESIITIEADDGTLVTIRRTTTTSNGITTSGFSVSLSDQGDQYFSGLLRDAPEISRSATAVLSNCAADCEQEITLSPPLQGFTAAGNGDGFSPLVDLDTERVWQINHLFDGTYFGLGWSQVVCMDARTQGQCSNWSPLDKEFYGHFIPDEVLDTSRNRLYYPGMGQSVSPDANGRRTGTCSADLGNIWAINGDCEFFIACTNTSANSHCEPTKISDDFWGGGPWMIGGELWATSAEGNIYCIDPDQIGTAFPWCAGYDAAGKATAATGNLATSSYFRALITGEVLSGTKLVIYNAPNNVFYCWDTSKDQNCAGFGLVNAGVDYSASSVHANRFLRYNTSGDVVGWCLSRAAGWVSNGTVPHTCVNAQGSVSSNPVPNLRNDQGQFLTWNEGYTYVSQDRSVVRMFFSGYAPVNQSLADSGVVNCYDWITQNMCSDIDIDFGTSIDTYTFTTFLRECLIGVGDQSQFVTFSALTGEACTSSRVDELIYPCACNNGSNEFRWGSIELPNDFKDVLNSAHSFVLTSGGTIIDPTTGNTVSGQPSANHSVAHDLMSDGAMDLSALNGQYSGPLTLVVIVDAKLKADGTLEWVDEKSVVYDLVVQPTLSG